MPWDIIALVVVVYLIIGGFNAAIIIDHFGGERWGGRYHSKAEVIPGGTAAGIIWPVFALGAIIYGFYWLFTNLSIFWPNNDD